MNDYCLAKMKLKPERKTKTIAASLGAAVVVCLIYFSKSISSCSLSRLFFLSFLFAGVSAQREHNQRVIYTSVGRGRLSKDVAVGVDDVRETSRRECGAAQREAKFGIIFYSSLS